MKLYLDVSINKDDYFHISMAGTVATLVILDGIRYHNIKGGFTVSAYLSKRPATTALPDIVTSIYVDHQRDPINTELCVTEYHCRIVAIEGTRR